MTDTTTEVVDRYLDDLRAALADLPPHELEDVLDDITPHLDELARDGVDHAGLVAEVGAPATYAAELRAAAGYPEPGVDPAVHRPRLLLLRLVIGTLTAVHAGLYCESIMYGSSKPWVPVSLLLLVICARPLTRCDPSVAEVFALPVVSRLRPPPAIAGYLRSLLPGWFVVGGVLTAIGVYRYGDRLHWVQVFPIVVGLACGLLVLLAGQRSLRDRRWLWLAIPGSAYAVGVGLHLLDGPIRVLLPGTMHA